MGFRRPPVLSCIDPSRGYERESYGTVGRYSSVEAVSTEAVSVEATVGALSRSMLSDLDPIAGKSVPVGARF